MKQIIPTITTLLSILFCIDKVSAQTHILLSPDKKTNCKLIKEGKFISQDYSVKDYYLVVSKDTITEFVQDGKYYLKSKVEFISDCSYKSNIIMTTIPDYKITWDQFAITEIIQTQCNFIKIKTKMGATEVTTVLEKVE